MERIGLEALFEDAQFRAGIKNYIKQIEQAEKTTDKAADGITKETKSIGEEWDRSGKLVAAAAVGMGAAITALLTKVTMVAARNQELAVVVQTVGTNIGHTRKEMLAYVEGVKSMGITTQAAQQAIIQMAQAQIDLSYATDLARLAQDAAVIGQMDSSEAFQKLITGIQRGSLVMLRQVGIAADFQGAYSEMAKQLGKTANELTQEEKVLARVNNVMKASEQIAGTYEAAMGTAGKQARSMSRYVEELANELGQELLPVYSGVIMKTTDLLKWMRDLDPAIKATAVDMLAMAAGISTVAGTAALAIPKIMGMVKALSALRAVQALGGLGPVGLAVGAIGAVVSAAVYFHELEEAHREEAAAIIDSAESYRQYVTEMEKADLAAYTMSETLWEQAKAAEEAGKRINYLALQEARQEFLKTGEALGNMAEAMPDFIAETESESGKMGILRDRMSEVVKELDDLTLMVVADEQEMQKLAHTWDLSYTEAERLGTMIAKLAEEEQKYRVNTENLNALEGQRARNLDEMVKKIPSHVDQMKAQTHEMLNFEAAADDGTVAIQGFGAEVPKVVQDMSNLAQEADLTEEEIEELADAFKEANDAAVDLRKDSLIGLANALVSLRDLEDEAAQGAEDYETRLADLNAEMAGIKSEKIDFEMTLPDPTTVAERQGMMEDAWDEWALRIQDIIVNGVASPYYEELQKMGYTKPPDVGVTEWAEDMKRTFYAGGLEELINKDTQAWRNNAATVAESQAEATQKFEEGKNKRIAGLREERDELERAEQARLQAQKSAQERALIEFALTLADVGEAGRSELDKWAQQTIEMPGLDTTGLDVSVQDVLAMIDSGVIEVDAALATLLSNYSTGIGTVKEQTAGVAEANAQLLSDIATGDWAKEMETQAQDMIAGFRRVPEFAEELAKTGEATPIDPFEEWLGQIEDADGAMEALSQTGATGMQDIAGAIETATGKFPPLQKAFEGFKTSAVGGIQTLLDEMAKIPSRIDVEVVISTTYNPTVPTATAVQVIIDRLNAIPNRINVDVAMAFLAGSEGLMSIGTDVGTRLGDRIVEAITYRTRKDWKVPFKLMEQAGTLSAIGGFFANLYEEQYEQEVLEPVAERLREINDILGRQEQEVENVGDRYREITRQQEELSEMLEDPAFLRRLTEEQYQELLQRRLNLTAEQNALNEEMNQLAEERNELEELYAQKQEKVARFQEAQQRMDILEQQLSLLRLIYDLDFDPAYILRDMQFGLDVAFEDMIDMTTTAMDRLVQAAEDKLKERLGIASPSKLMIEIGAQAKAGFLQGWDVPPRQYLPERSYAPAADPFMLRMPVPQLPAPSGPTINLDFGGTTINTDMDEAIFYQRVKAAVREAVIYG